MWGIAAAFLTGLCVAEYYNRGRIDKIRREQIDDLRGRQRRRIRDDALDFDFMEPQRREPDDLISQEQYDEMRRTGRTAGRRINNV